MGKHLFGLGTGTLCLSVFCLLLNRAGTPAYVASMCALVASLALLTLSFVAPLLMRWLLDPKAAPKSIKEPAKPASRSTAHANASR